MNVKFKNIVIIGLMFIMISCSTILVSSKKNFNNVHSINKELYVTYGSNAIQEKIYTGLKTDQLINQEQKLEITIGEELEESNYSALLYNATKDVSELKELYIDNGDIDYIIEITNTYYLIASICRNYGYISLANEYFNAANKLNSSFKITTTGFTDVVKSEYYFQAAQYEQSKQCALSAIKMANESDNKEILVTAWINLARVQITLGELPEAKETLIEISKNLKYAQTAQVMGEYYYCCGGYAYEGKYYNAAIEYLLKAYNMNKDGGNYRLNMSILINLAQAYSNLGEYKLSNEYYAKEVQCTREYITTCQVINGSVLNDIRDANPNEIFYELIMERRGPIYAVIAILFLIVVVSLVIAIYKNKAKRKRVEELNEALYRDELTEAYNRTYLRKKMKFYIGHNKKFIVAIFDIDDYKQVNDTFGHVFGDKVLVDTVKVMKETLKENFIIGRYGGEEFLIIGNNLSIEEFSLKMEELRKSIEQLTWENGHHITISGGVYSYRKGDSMEKVVDEADSLLYKAKRSGKNKIEYEK